MRTLKLITYVLARELMGCLYIEDEAVAYFGLIDYSNSNFLHTNLNIGSKFFPKYSVN